ncbi:S9 family peptidase [candidate division WOR-3 bacterium]|nr:S9 family peptidase [candidate division WOR-3 bacterium]
MKYPVTKKRNFTEELHGKQVADPYRWLEKIETEEVGKWVSEQNKFSKKFLRDGAAYDKILKELKKIWYYSSQNAPSVKGGKYFYLANDGTQNHNILYVKESLDAPPRILLDPNKWSKDGSSSLSVLYISDDGKYLVYGISRSGSDWQDIKILDVEKTKDLPETLKWCRFTFVSWKKDSSGFFYNRFPEETSVPPEDRINYSKVYFHELNSDQSQDVLIFEDNKNKEQDFYPVVTYDGEYLLIFAGIGTDNKNLVYVRKLIENKRFIRLIPDFEAEYTYVYNIGDIFFFKTDLNAPFGKIVSIDLKNPSEKAWKEVVPETRNKLLNATTAGEKFILEYLYDAHSVLKIYSLEGKLLNEIQLPGLGTVLGISGEPDLKDIYFKYTSFTYPGIVYQYDINRNEMKEFSRDGLSVDQSEFTIERLIAVSKDGTKVPYFLVRGKSVERNGSNPTILYGYGGFNIPETPSFSVSLYYWLKKGGIYALANLRGGGEFGEVWHKGGMLGNKQNVFEDFIAVAQSLIENGFTQKEKLAIRGGSNGGLLTGACMIQKPELFGAVVCQVGVLDMLRYHKWTVGRYWIPEYGDPENKEHFQFLYAYSPVHNVKKGVKYPPVLITTADTDDRVYPAHSFKFAAELQEKSSGESPVLLRIEEKAGHGHGKSLSKLVEQASDIYSFLNKTLGLEG